MALMYPLIFMGRRLIFAAVVIFQASFTWLHLFYYSMTTIAMIVYIGYAWPFESD